MATKWGLMLCVDRTDTKRPSTPCLVYITKDQGHYVPVDEGYVQTTFTQAFEARKRFLTMFPKNFYAVVEITHPEVA